MLVQHCNTGTMLVQYNSWNTVPCWYNIATLYHVDTTLQHCTMLVQHCNTVPCWYNTTLTPGSNTTVTPGSNTTVTPGSNTTTLTPHPFQQLQYGTVQFIYTCVQHHSIWQSVTFWERAFYCIVQVSSYTVVLLGNTKSVAR